MDKGHRYRFLVEAKRLAREGVAWGCYHSGIVGMRLRRLSRSAYPILMYHRVLSRQEAGQGVEPGMYVTPESFEKHLVFLKRHFTVLSLETLWEKACNASSGGGGERYCAITFDDGWRDFYENAYPLIEQYQVPATVFLPTGFIGENQLFWTDRLIGLFCGEGRVARERAPHPLVAQIEGLTGNRDEKIEKAVALLKEYHLDEIEKVISILSERWQVDYNDLKRVFLDWREVNDMLLSGFISFGSHTHRHQILTTLDEREISEELIVSRDRLLSMNVVSPRFLSFCYPNGNCDDSVAHMVQEAGFSLAVTTERGWNRWGANPYRLKRISVHQDMASSEKLFGCRLADLL